MTFLGVTCSSRVRDFWSLKQDGHLREATCAVWYPHAALPRLPGLSPQCDHGVLTMGLHIPHLGVLGKSYSGVFIVLKERRSSERNAGK